MVVQVLVADASIRARQGCLEGVVLDSGARDADPLYNKRLLLTRATWLVTDHSAIASRPLLAGWPRSRIARR